MQVYQAMAMEAIAKGLQPPPMPQMPPELVQEMQRKQQLQNSQQSAQLGNPQVANQQPGTATNAPMQDAGGAIEGAIQ